MVISRRCNRCHETFTGKRCTNCANKVGKERRMQNERLKLYSSAAWNKCRRDVRLKYLDYDIWLLGIGVVRRCDGVTVHHIIEREEAPGLVFSIDNLITVGTDSHAEIHALYKTNKAVALARIREGIRRFKEMFEE